MSRTGPSSKEQELITEVLSYKYDPLGFVLYAFPWGVKGKPLEKFAAPRDWQTEEFIKIGEHMKQVEFCEAMGVTPPVYYLSISSGRGIGKSAFLAMLELFVASCWPGSTTIVTANTEPQLRSRTMAELGKWHTMAINRHWFDKSSMSLRPQKWFADLLKDQLGMDTQYYYIEGQNWSEENPDAFAGAHSQIGMMVVYDEASGIPDSIWNVTDGFFTDLAPLRMWVTISNPRRNTGRFFDCFHEDKESWVHKCIDGRSIEGVDHTVYQRIVDKYGEDHDTTRIEVRGEFPRTGDNQFIGREVVEDAQIREVVPDDGEPLIMGVDVARYGDDDSVVRFRRGRDARSIPRVSYSRINLMELADNIAELIDRYQPDAVMVDGGGVGGGVVDRLRSLGYRVTEVQSGASADDTDNFTNKRAEMWSRMKEWLVTGCLEEGRDIVLDMTGLEYEVDLRGRLKLESKKDAKKRGIDSPDDSDALSFTFAHPVARRDIGLSRRRMVAQTAISDYDEFD